MADPSKGAPQPFNASLFGSGAGSSLSFDLDTSGIASPIVIGPVSKGKDSASSTPPQTRSASPSSHASLSGSKTRPAPTAASLFSTPGSGSTPPSFSTLLAHPPEPSGTIQTLETELETVDLGSPTTTSAVEPPSNPQPVVAPMLMDSASLYGPPPSSVPPPTSLQPSGPTMTPMPPQAVVAAGGGGGGEESNPYRLSARHMGRPLHQTVAPPPQAPFLGSGIMPPAPPPSTMETLGIPPPASSASGYSPILPPPTSGGYQGTPSQMAPPMFYSGSAGGVYQPVRPHWFYLRSGDRYWTPFTLVDSSR